jgi:hypothetical protein
MLRRLGACIAVASVPALIGAVALGPASLAQAVSVGPQQYFYGDVYGPVSTTGSASQSVIDVTCSAAALTGHPVSGQTVKVTQIFPPPATTAGYTGDDAVEIDTSLIYTVGTLSADIPIATFTQYSVTAPIPTSITVPCSGSGVMSFTPYPDDSGTPSDVTVTFVSTG